MIERKMGTTVSLEADWLLDNAQAVCTCRQKNILGTVWKLLWTMLVEL